MTKVQVIDLFSGCGGMSYGFKVADTTGTGVEHAVLGGLDTNEHANATYERMVEAPALNMDVRDLLTPEGLRAATEAWGYDPALPLVLIGCAPCQGFSSHRKKDSRSDPRNSLVAAFGEVVAALRPDVVVMENVPEIFRDTTWDHYETWRGTVEEAGYAVRARIHNLAQFGVPQERFRALALAYRDRERFGLPEPRLRPSEYATVRDAIGDLRPLEAGEAHPDDPMHVTSNHRKSTVDLIALIPPDGGSRRDLPEGVGPDCWQGVDGFRDVYGRMWWDRPANAITARCRTPSTGRYSHPEQNRGLSVREAALLQGFPGDYMFSGPFDERFRQIGNAVSPVFSECIAESVAHELGGEERAGHLDTTGDVVSPIEKSISSSLASLKRKMREADSLALLPLFDTADQVALR